MIMRWTEVAEMAEVTCPLCRSHRAVAGFQVRTNALFTLVTCQDCRLRFTWPRPTPAELAEFYGADYFSNGDGGLLGYEDYRSVGEVNARRAWSVLNRFTNLDGIEP